MKATGIVRKLTSWGVSSSPGKSAAPCISVRATRYRQQGQPRKLFRFSMLDLGKRMGW